jgi:hypothetical protein
MVRSVHLARWTLLIERIRGSGVGVTPGLGVSKFNEAEDGG